MISQSALCGFKIKYREWVIHTLTFEVNKCHIMLQTARDEHFVDHLAGLFTHPTLPPKSLL